MKVAHRTETMNNEYHLGLHRDDVPACRSESGFSFWIDRRGRGQTDSPEGATDQCTCCAVHPLETVQGGLFRWRLVRSYADCRLTSLPPCFSHSVANYQFQLTNWTNWIGSAGPWSHGFTLHALSWHLHCQGAELAKGMSSVAFRHWVNTSKEAGVTKSESYITLIT